MAKQQSSFDLKHIEETAMVESSGILDQLNLPPGLIDFLRKNKRTLWFIFGVIATVVVVVSLYGSYRNYMITHATTAYDQAMLLDGSQKKEALQALIEKYGSTLTAVWSKVELARMDEAAGDIHGAIDKLLSISSSLEQKSLIKPLVLVSLGGLYEQDKQPDKALDIYEQLKTFQGFASFAVNSMGRVYEVKGDTTEAVRLFKEYLRMTMVDGKAPQGNNPVRAMVQATLNRLEK